MVSHISQLRWKRVRVVPDALERYANDERWRCQVGLERASAEAFLGQIQGNEYYVYKTINSNGLIWYFLLINPEVLAPDHTGLVAKRGVFQLTADYCEVVDSGYMEAS